MVVRVIVCIFVLGMLGNSSFAQVTTELMNSNEACIREISGSVQCPADPMPAANEIVGNGPFLGSICGFEGDCSFRTPPKAGQPLRVCNGFDGNGTPIQIDLEVVVMNAGTATQVPTFTSVDPMAIPPEQGHLLNILDQISCFKITECNCGNEVLPKCKRGKVTIYALARYEISNIGCESVIAL